MDNWISALFSMDSGAITQGQATALVQLNAQWVLLNVRNSRFFIDVCGPPPVLTALQSYLQGIGRNPTIIAVFDHSLVDDGSGNGTFKQVEQMRVGPGFNQAEYLNVAPNVITYDALGNVLTSVRPTTFVPLQKFAGWGDKVGIPF
jgi:hypothetical protein